eukprot:1149076-Pelagomonas_calceolata.AAC.7
MHRCCPEWLKEQDQNGRVPRQLGIVFSTNLVDGAVRGFGFEDRGWAARHARSSQWIKSSVHSGPVLQKLQLRGKKKKKVCSEASTQSLAGEHTACPSRCSNEAVASFDLKSFWYLMKAATCALSTAARTASRACQTSCTRPTTASWQPARMTRGSTSISEYGHIRLFYVSESVSVIKDSPKDCFMVASTHDTWIDT